MKKEFPAIQLKPYICRQMNTAYLSLGSNEGDRVLWISKAIEQIGDKCGPVTRQSSMYETAAWGINTQPDFLNMVIAIQTILAPHELLNSILAIEKSLGRHRGIKWGPRIIDIDILFFGNDVINFPDLIIPHPYLHLRRFTLAPLAEIAADLLHPVFKKSIKTLLSECQDPLEVHLFPVSY